MEELLRKINETFDNCIENSSEETKLQLKIIKNNINTLFSEYNNTSQIPQSVQMSNDGMRTLIDEIKNEDIDKNNRKNILIVDDSSIVRNFLQKSFSDEYNVIMAVDGQDAIEKLSDEGELKKINLILLDLMMPVIDGFGVLEYLNGKNINVPVMIISGDNSKDTINRAFQYNVVDVIEKPFDAKKIKDKINRFINL